MRGGVVVTGASTGIGYACALHLDRIGFRVFAGVRRDEDAERLRAQASERLVPVKLDVTDAASIRAAADEVDCRPRKRAAQRPRQQCRNRGLGPGRVPADR